MSSKNLPILVDLHKNVFFDEEKGEVAILDRRKIPQEISEYRCKNYNEVARAIEKMVTQSLGVSPAAGYGMAIAAYEARDKRKEKKKEIISNAAKRIKNTRPTQTSLHYLTNEILSIAEETIENNGPLFDKILEKAYNWTERIMETSRTLGKYASQIIEDGDTILTHCYGGPAIYFMGDYARKENKVINYFATETRPYLQGARLTSFALKQGGFDVTIITDGMPAYCLQNGLIDKFITGADRISMDGGVANKIGTYQIAIASDRHKVPFYAISYTGPDQETSTYKDIEIEERDPEEITSLKNIRIAPEGVKAFYPAFDCTPPELVRGIITEKGIYGPEKISDYFKEK